MSKISSSISRFNPWFWIWIVHFTLPLNILFASPAPPSIQSLLKMDDFQKVTHDFEIVTQASLKDAPDSKEVKTYSFYASMLARASLELTRKVMMDFPNYSKLIAFVDRTEFFPDSKELQISGGIFGFTMTSRLKFKEISERWIEYRIIRDSFEGLTGEIFFESFKDQGTLVYMRGGMTGKPWPPAFVMERGAEVVFRATGRKMKSQIELQKNPQSTTVLPPTPMGAPVPKKTL